MSRWKGGSAFAASIHGHTQIMHFERSQALQLRIAFQIKLRNQCPYFLQNDLGSSGFARDESRIERSQF